MVTERKVRVVGVVICFRLVPQYVIWILLYLYLPLPFSYIIHMYSHLGKIISWSL